MSGYLDYNDPNAYFTPVLEVRMAQNAKPSYPQDLAEAAWPRARLTRPFHRDGLDTGNLGRTAFRRRVTDPLSRPGK